MQANPFQEWANTAATHLQQIIAPASTPSYVRPATPPAPAIPIDKIRESIANNETGGLPTPYTFSRSSGSKKGGRALGKYQVTEGELETYAKRYLGASTSPGQFMSSSTLQDKYMNGKINYLASQGYTPQQIADIHRSGITKTADPGATNYQNPKYVAAFNRTFQPASSTRSVSDLIE